MTRAAVCMRSDGHIGVHGGDRLYIYDHDPPRRFTA
jgi:hypothetical protein